MQKKIYARIGYMPEERGLYKKMKIGEQAIYFAQAERTFCHPKQLNRLKTGSYDLKCNPGGIKKLRT